MKRITTTTRNNWQEEVEALGFGFHSTDVPYWDESAYYSFNTAQIRILERATTELWQMCLTAVEHVITKKKYDLFHIPKFLVPHIIDSWENDVPSVYGRFDLQFDGANDPKMLEFNADTPTSLYEASIIQWYWLQDFDNSKDQFNSIHEKLIETWKNMHEYLHDDVLYFACIEDSLEDFTTTEYMRDCAIQAGIETDFLFIEKMGWDNVQQEFVDEEENVIKNIFKLYPWEWIANEEFGENIPKVDTVWVEPSWKMILSNKAILPVLWELFPNHPYLLPAYFEPKDMKDYVKKPILSREGANVQIFENGKVTNFTDGEYGEEGFIYQGLAKLPNFEGNFPVIGSWIIGQQPAGIGIREAYGPITNNTSRFVPHLIS